MGGGYSVISFVQLQFYHFHLDIFNCLIILAFSSLPVLYCIMNSSIFCHRLTLVPWISSPRFDHYLTWHKVCSLVFFCETKHWQVWVINGLSVRKQCNLCFRINSSISVKLGMADVTDKLLLIMAEMRKEP